MIKQTLWIEDEIAKEYSPAVIKISLSSIPDNIIVFGRDLNDYKRIKTVADIVDAWGLNKFVTIIDTDMFLDGIKDNRPSMRTTDFPLFPTSMLVYLFLEDTIGGNDVCIRHNVWSANERFENVVIKTPAMKITAVDMRI